MSNNDIPEIFVEALGQVSASNGVLILNFIGRQPQLNVQQNDSAPQVVKQRVIMPLTSLPATVQLFNQLLAQLEKQKVFQRVDDGSVTVGNDGSVN